ncbi:hypothetical protein A8708_08940 [Paenibacillus oryzisoli]|uniref:Uncharacterized protein n=1 Tax=Paenibacillus oryzisoli TaxID=1850517 RepID=A0A198ATN4_9BACL|nr:hypothetical protein A8708_08940 [Paenibacillus oryzisoli]
MGKRAHGGCGLRERTAGADCGSARRGQTVGAHGGDRLRERTAGADCGSARRERTAEAHGGSARRGQTAGADFTGEGRTLGQRGEIIILAWLIAASLRNKARFLG